MDTRKHVARTSALLVLFVFLLPTFSFADAVPGKTQAVLESDEFDSRIATIAAIKMVGPLMKEKDYEAAIAVLDEAEEKTGKAGEIVFALGVVKQIAGRDEDAITDFSEAISMDFEGGLPYAYRGASQFRLGNNDRALDDFNAAIELSPKTAVCYQKRSGFYDRTGKHRAALKDLDTLIQLEPSAPAYAARAACHQKTGDHEASIRDATSAIGLEPAGEIALHIRSGSAMKAGKWTLALKDFNRLTEIKPTAKTYLGRAIANGKLGNFEAAVVNATLALEHDPKVRFALSVRAACNGEMGKWEMMLED